MKQYHLKNLAYTRWLIWNLAFIASLARFVDIFSLKELGVRHEAKSRNFLDFCTRCKRRRRAMSSWAAMMLSSTILMACKPAADTTAQERYIECLDKICDDDTPPAFNHSKEQITKVNGQWFIGPKEYGIFDGSLDFFWPSKTPANMEHAEKYAPEFRPSTGKENSNARSVVIEIFLRSSNIPPEPHGYKLIELAEKKHWIASKKTMRPGLDVIEMKHVLGPQGRYIDYASYYVATQLKGADGLPPVAMCSNDGGGTGFMWRPGIWVGMRMHAHHCKDWPEIFIELTHVLEKLRKA